MAAKITFPNRPCPKCGKAIHVRTKRHDCGWKAVAATAKAAPAKTSPARAVSSSNGKPMSKMAAVRQIRGSRGTTRSPSKSRGC